MSETIELSLLTNVVRSHSTWNDQHSSQGLPEPKALSNYYV